MSIPVIFVVGPTASGKTAVSYELAKIVGGQIINADVGQFYQKLKVGTAKPDWQSHPVKSYLFDICSEPVDFSIVQYRMVVLNKIKELQRDGIVPIVVGGSFFYVSSLFFPMREKSLPASMDNDFEVSWELLQSIDPIRASQIHPHDFYRIKRALTIWYESGKIPSSLEPVFDFAESAYILGLTPPKDVLQKRIKDRTYQMLEHEGWIAESQDILGTEWEGFVRKKGLLGYDIIFDALLNNQVNIDLLAPRIIQETEQYAKRQMTFYRGFVKKIISLQHQKKKLAIDAYSDHSAISYSKLSRMVAYLQK